MNSGGWLVTDGKNKGDGECAGIVVIDEKGARWESLEGKLKS